MKMHFGGPKCTGGSLRPAIGAGRGNRLSDAAAVPDRCRIGRWRILDFNIRRSGVYCRAVFVDLQPLMKNLELAKIDFNIRRGGGH
jgi:hypothetical protein